MVENIAKQEIVLVYLAKFVKAVTQIEKKNLLQKKLDMKILGIGNAIVDVICKVNDNFLKNNGLIKSTMKLVDEKEFQILLKNLQIEKTISGGSVANSIVGLSQLGNEVGFIGKVSDDDLANELSKRQKEKSKNLSYFVQVNLGSEEQKGGIEINSLKSFVNYCIKKLDLSVIGLMAIPPNNKETEKHFKIISDLNRQFNFEHLSIGMSNDYLLAIKYGASFVRIGSAIFGNRS